MTITRNKYTTWIDSKVSDAQYVLYVYRMFSTRCARYQDVKIRVNFSKKIMLYT
jgi:hypothetical protein